MSDFLEHSISSSENADVISDMEVNELNTFSKTAPQFLGDQGQFNKAYYFTCKLSSFQKETQTMIGMDSIEDLSLKEVTMRIGERRELIALLDNIHSNSDVKIYTELKDSENSEKEELIHFTINAIRVTNLTDEWIIKISGTRIYDIFEIVIKTWVKLHPAVFNRVDLFYDRFKTPRKSTLLDIKVGDAYEISTWEYFGKAYKVYFLQIHAICQFVALNCSSSRFENPKDSSPRDQGDAHIYENKKGDANILQNITNYGGIYRPPSSSLKCHQTERTKHKNEGPKPKLQKPTVVSEQLEMFKKEVTYLIGRNGCEIEKIRNRSGAKILIPVVGPSVAGAGQFYMGRLSTQTIYVSGTQAQVKFALDLINHRLLLLRAAASGAV